MTKSMEKNYDEYDVSKSWKAKFRIFDKAGKFNGFTYENYKILSFKDRRKIGFNIFAFLFGYFYYFSKKMYHKGALILGISFIYTSILIFIEKNTNIVFHQTIYWIPISAIIASIASYDYYKFITKKEKMWSIFPSFFSTRYGAIIFPLVSFIIYLFASDIFNNYKNFTDINIKPLNFNIQHLSNNSEEETNINLVKNGIMNFNKTLTVGEALDNWKNCKHSKWESFTTDNGVNVVEFRCSLKNIEKFTYKLKSFLPNLFPNEDKLNTSFLDVLSSTQVFQFTINKDNTFQIDNVQVETVWKDGSKYSDSLNQMDILERAYNNELTYNVDSLDKANVNEIYTLLNLFVITWKNSIKTVDSLKR